MALKETTKEIFERYGLTEEEYNAYIVFLAFPQVTVSEVAGILEKDIDEIKTIADKLEEKGFIRKIPGIIERYIPLEPYLELFNETSRKFREDISEIKDKVLADQSSRFENLEKIQDNALSEIENSKVTQIEEFQRESDQQDVDKKTLLDNSRDRFTKTGKDLEDDIQKTTFSARDRFTETANELMKNVEDSDKKLEADLHSNIDARYEDFQSEVNKKDEETKKLWDSHAEKFANDNEQLNSELDSITENHKNITQQFEQSIHSMIDGLKQQANELSESFKEKYTGGIAEQKSTLNKIVDDLLGDFRSRIEKLETELKKELDDHHQYEVDTANALKPKLDEILEKYMIRMKKVLDELKDTFSQLLKDHSDQLTGTNNEMDEELTGKINQRQEELIEEIKSFEEKTTELITNIIDISQKMSDLGTVLSSRGSAFKALLLGKHKEWVAINEEIQNKIGQIGEDIRQEFLKGTEGYLEETKETREQLIQQIHEITEEKNKRIVSINEEMDKKQKETLSAELESLATDLSQECYNAVDACVNDGKDRITKLKDSLESSLHTHHDNFEIAINKHRNTGLGHYDDCNKDVLDNIASWYKQIEREHESSKKDVSLEIKNQIREIDDYLNKSKSTHNDHTREFRRDVDAQKTEQRRIYDDLLRNVKDNFKELKTKISDLVKDQISYIKEKINQEIDLFKDEIAQLDQKQHESIDNEIELFSNETTQLEEKIHALLESHKSAYKENATNLQQRLNKIIQDNIQNVKDAIADFTLNFMNSIDECYELAEENEDKLSDIAEAAKNVKTLGESTTWHVFGHQALIEAMVDAMWRTKSTITIITPQAEPKILEELSKVAFKKKSTRFLYTTNWDLATYGQIIETMKKLGNIQFRNLQKSYNFFALSRDSEEIVLCPKAKSEEDMIAIVSIHEGYAEIFSSFIHPMFQANSRPI